jgi:hypothetical protein
MNTDYLEIISYLIVSLFIIYCQYQKYKPVVGAICQQDGCEGWSTNRKAFFECACVNSKYTCNTCYKIGVCEKCYTNPRRYRNIPKDYNCGGLVVSLVILFLGMTIYIKNEENMDSFVHLYWILLWLFFFVLYIDLHLLWNYLRTVF